MKKRKEWRQRFRCLDCGHRWSYQKKKQKDRLTVQEKKIARESIERGSMRILGRRYRLSRTAIMRLVHKVTNAAKDSIWVAQNFPLHWSGILVIDGKSIRVYDQIIKKLDLKKFTGQEIRWMHKKVWLCGIDYLTGDLPHYELADEETMVDLVLFFRVLKKIGYPLKVLVSDGNEEIVRAARHVYGNAFLHQLCTRHFIEGLKRKVGEGVLAFDHQTNDLIMLIQSIIEAEALKDSLDNLVKLKRKKLTTPIQREMLKNVEAQMDELTTHLQHQELNIPHTSNDIENLFRQLNLRLKSIGMFGDFRTARNYLKAWALWRRTTKFTDCRGARKTRNGRSPLELACRKKLVDIDFLSL